MDIKGCEVKVIQGDITAQKVDAIVNAANNKLLMGGGVAGAIKRKGGKVIEDEAVKKGPIAIGEAVATKAGKLSAKFVIHAATMGMDFQTDEEKIRLSCRNALKAAEELKIRSVAFPALGCGVGGFSLVAAAKIMSQEVLRYLRCSDSRLKEIVFALYNKESFEIFNKHVTGYLDYMINKLGNGPYVTVDTLIEMPDNRIVLIERKNPPFGWAIPGGFVDYGESLEDAARREAEEETGLRITGLKQFHTYSEPKRDPRFHTIGTVYIAKAEGSIKAGDDAAKAAAFTPDEAMKLDLAFDHKDILRDYLKCKNRGAGV